MNNLVNPVFIVGAPRSGTTLLQYILRAHPGISIPTGESHFIIPLMRYAETFGDLRKRENVRKVLEAMYAQSAEFLDTDLHGMKFDIDQLSMEFHSEKRSTMVSIIRGLYEKNARGEGKMRWADKTPYYVLHMVRLKKWFPDAKFIHVIRDGRDVALSMFVRRHDFRIYNCYLAAKYWQQCVDAGRAQGAILGAENYAEIRYEELVVDARSTIRSLCDFLREEYTDALLRYAKPKEGGKTPLLKGNIKGDNFEKWRTEMTSHQIRMFEGGAGSTLRDCGYAISSNVRPLPPIIRATLRLHNHVARKIWRKFT